MDNLLEPTEYLTLGRFKLDVSNIPYYRKKISRIVWNEAIKTMQGDPEYDLEIFNDICDVYGLYMIRQPLFVLKRRMPFIKALKSYVLRYLLTVRYIKRLSETEYEAFHEWAYFQLTGVKKKELETTNQILEMEKRAIQEMEKLNISPDQLTELFSIFLQETAGKLNTLQHSKKVS